jgi:hypothetical protein
MRGIRRLIFEVGFVAVAGALAFVLRPAVAAAQLPQSNIQKLDVSGVGTGLATPVTCPSTASTGDTCYAISGAVHGDPIGDGTFTGILDVSGTTESNGANGLCAPASGTIALSFNSSQGITLGYEGDYCDVGAGPTGETTPSAASNSTTLTGSFFVTGGSGSRYSQLSGNYSSGGGGAGTIVISGDPLLGSLLFLLDGVLDFVRPFLG